MKSKFLLFLLTMSVVSTSPAGAAVVTDRIAVDKKNLLTFSTKNFVTLNPNGCEEVYIDYSISKSHYFPNSYVMFGLYSAANNEAQSIYIKPGNGKGDQGKDPWKGDKELIFCGKAKSYVNEYGDKVVAPAFAKGTYTLMARFTFLKPKLITYESKKITFTVK